MFLYFLLPHWLPATWRNQAQTSIRAEFPSGKLPTARVRRRISRFSLSTTLLVRNLLAKNHCHYRFSNQDIKNAAFHWKATF